MKNYYLKRIDELETKVGSDRQGTPIKSAIMAVGSPLLPSAARGLTNLRSSLRKSMALARLKAKKNSKERQDRLKAAAEKRKKEKQEREAMEVQRTAMDDFGRPRQENSSTAYLQIGYILAESLGLL
jgi:hypothetical protein